MARKYLIDKIIPLMTYRLSTGRAPIQVSNTQITKKDQKRVFFVGEKLVLGEYDFLRNGNR